jgi:hypothetical protein
MSEGQVSSQPCASSRIMPVEGQKHLSLVKLVLAAKRLQPLQLSVAPRPLVASRLAWGMFKG